MKHLAACRFLLVSLSLVGSSVVSADANRSRSELQIAVNAYLEAQVSGDRQMLPAAPLTRYYEQQESIDAHDSIVHQPLTIDFQRSILDEASCQTFTELVVLDTRHPYAMGVRLRVVAGTITELESAANAYFDQFFSGPDTVYVPWGTPCNRLEDGAYTGTGSPNDSCNVGVPSGTNISHRRFVVDEALGAIVGFVRFGPNLTPDAHLFRVENDRIRYAHTLTVCPETGCAFN